MIEFAAALCLVVTVVLCGLWWRARGALNDAVQRRNAIAREREAAENLLGALPLRGYRWPEGADAPTPLVRPVPGSDDKPFADFLGELDAADAARLSAALDRLRRDGRPFAAAVSTPAGRAYQIEASTTAGGEMAIWITDASSLREAEHARAAASADAGASRARVDALPMPVWRRDCGVAHRRLQPGLRRSARPATRRGAGAIDANWSPTGCSPWPGPLLAGGSAASNRLHAVISGSRRLLDITEVPDGAGGTIGLAIDRTDVENAEAELSRHVNAHGQMLENIHAAVAIYGADKRLSFFNSAFATLWGLEEDWLVGEPSLDELLERLRERRRMPEYADFRAFKRQQLDMFTSLIEPQTELMHLPDGRTLSASVSPHPLGGLIFIYEDVTDRLALERSYNTLIAVQRETLDNLFEGIAVFGSDGRLKLHNPAYREIWDLSGDDVAGEPHFSEIVEKTRAFYDDGGDWPAARGRSSPASRRRRRLERPARPPRRLGAAAGDRAAARWQHALHLCRHHRHDPRRAGAARAQRGTGNRRPAEKRVHRQCFVRAAHAAERNHRVRRNPGKPVFRAADLAASSNTARAFSNSSHRLMGLINDILDLATIEAGYMVLESAEVDIREMLQSVMTLSRERTRTQSLSLTMNCPPDIGALEADERRLKQALFNLVSNADQIHPGRRLDPP